MKNLILILGIFILPITSIYSQCEINPYIQNNYEFDAKILALRKIQTNTNDPDYNNPYLLEERVIPYLEGLSAIYENEINEPIIDSFFNELQIHVHPSYLNLAYYKRITIGFDNSTEWLNDFINTGISGVPALDNLMVEYDFSIYDTHIFTNHTFIDLETSYDILNILALVGDFEQIENMYSVDPVLGPEGGYNYAGPPYEVSEEGDLAKICDIVEINDVYTFSLHGGDCPSGCIYTVSWDISVSENCEIIYLSNQDITFKDLSIYPNPSREIINISGITKENYSIKIYTPQGQIVKSISSKAIQINVASLTPGIYFIKIQTEDNKLVIKKLIIK